MAETCLRAASRCGRKSSFVFPAVSGRVPGALWPTFSCGVVPRFAVSRAPIGAERRRRDFSGPRCCTGVGISDPAAVRLPTAVDDHGDPEYVRVSQQDFDTEDVTMADKKTNQAKRVADLIHEAVDKGATTVEEIHKSIADLPLKMLEGIEVLKKPVKEVRRVQDRSIAAVYNLIREINEQIRKRAAEILNRRRAAPGKSSAAPRKRPATSKRPKAASASASTGTPTA